MTDLTTGNSSALDSKSDFRQPLFHDLWGKTPRKLNRAALRPKHQQQATGLKAALGMPVPESTNQPCAEHRNIARLARWW